MTVSVWADVGGTFTDCFLVDNRGRRATKILSSGAVYASVQSLDLDYEINVGSIPASEISGFWIGANISQVRGDGSLAEIGTVIRQSGTTIKLDRPLISLAPGHSILIDAGIESPVLATRMLLRIPLGDPLPQLDIRLGTTRGTNALLTRQGANTALLVTAGFADILRIGDQDRPDLFALAIQKPSPLTDTVVEVVERMDCRGNVLTSLDRDQLRVDLKRLRDEGVQSLAIALMHAYLNDTHERAVEDLARKIGFESISRSSEVAPLIKLVARAETTTLDAYLNPILAGYVAKLWNEFGGAATCRMRLMTSNGNLVAPPSFRGRDSILSGPAGGVVALAHVARRCDAKRAIGLDMGGTSTDVSRFEGLVGRRQETRVAGVRVMTPMMDIVTVAAGGGSICDFIDGRLIVGPASAGAEPGPACYGRGGPLTVTDVNLLLGRIPESRFPFALDRAAAQQRIRAIADRMPSGALSCDEELADGFLKIAVTHMAEAVRQVSTAQGTDVRQMALIGFGGASGQHLCRIASMLGMRRILDHPDAGMLSAIGMGLADVGRVVTRGIYRLASLLSPTEIEIIADQLRHDAHSQLTDEFDDGLVLNDRLDCDVRYKGTDAALMIELSPVETIEQRFHDSHRRTFGYAQPNRSIEVVAIRCESTLSRSAYPNEINATGIAPIETTGIDFWHDGKVIQGKLVDRAGLKFGTRIAAPAMIVGDHSTLLVEPGWQATVITDDVIELTPVTSETTTVDTDGQLDAVLIEVVARRLQGIADAMGEVLRRTSISVNVKERRDYSCAVFRGDGALIANAPHVPVHLGAMGHTVRQMMKSFPTMSPGDAYVSNDPFAGGSHLPDVTLVTPVFCDEKVRDAKPDFFVASRAHHAEIGGRTPGSMPPDATSLAEEGVLIRNFALIKSSVSHVDELHHLLTSGPYPSRSASENLADIAAAQAAGTYGASALRELASDYTIDVVDSLMTQILNLAAESMSRWIATLPTKPKDFSDQLDDGTKIAVRLQRIENRFSVQFMTAPVHPHGFNATPAIVTAAVLYVLRCVSGSNMPLCDGVLRDVDIVIHPGLLDPPAHDDPSLCAAVVAGNVETSQRIVDVLLGAIGVAAASQGTMNNVIFGDDTFGYYETIGGGSGATAGHDGADALHTHMTNTRITDPEVVESRTPVLLRRFAIRRHSGGAGKHRGGNGMIREFEFLKPLTLSLLTGRRTTRPYGQSGGEPGMSGRNTLVRGDETIQLPPTATISLIAGDRLIIETPGGGGWGKTSGL